MALTQQDLDTIDLRAGRLAERAIEKALTGHTDGLKGRILAELATADALAVHIDACPHGRAMAISRARLAGMIAGLSLAGASTGFTLAKLLL